MNAFEQLERERRSGDELAAVLRRYREDQAGKQLLERDADAALARHRALRHLPLHDLRKSKD